MKECIQLLNEKSIIYPDFLIVAAGTGIVNCLEYEDKLNH